MPELPEIETLVRELRPLISGLVFSKIRIFDPLIFKTPARVLERTLPRKKIQHIFRRGKFLVLSLSGNLKLWLHLGMTGQLLWLKKGAGALQDQHVHAVLEFKSDTSRLLRPFGARNDVIARSPQDDEAIPNSPHLEKNALVFRDVRKFGKIFLSNGKAKPELETIKTLGKDPFELNQQAFTELFRKRSGRIKSLLLNQRLMAGLGNIYADESLFEARLDPRSKPVRLSSRRLGNLFSKLMIFSHSPVHCISYGTRPSVFRGLVDFLFAKPRRVN